MLNIKDEEPIFLCHLFVMFQSQVYLEGRWLFSVDN